MKSYILYLLAGVLSGCAAAFLAFCVFGKSEATQPPLQVVGWRVIKYGMEYNILPAENELYAKSQAMSVGGRVEPIYSDAK